jgi:hypothetical protein
MPDGDETIPVPVPDGFFRFEVVWYSGGRKRALGVFRSAGYAEQEGEEHAGDERALRAVLRWFDRNLRAPRRLRRVAAIFWFRPHVAGETEIWARIVELARLLCRYGYYVEVARTTRPGKIVYHDETQIAAVPFRETFDAPSVPVGGSAAK